MWQQETHPVLAWRKTSSAALAFSCYFGTFCLIVTCLSVLKSPKVTMGKSKGFLDFHAAICHQTQVGKNVFVPNKTCVRFLE